MRRPRALPLPVRLLLAAALAGAASSAQEPRDAALRFAERWALAEDRAAVVETLLPGSEERFEYECRLAEQADDLVAVDRLLAVWSARHGRTARLSTMEDRRALLGFERDPAATFAHLRRRLGLSFEHRREEGGEPERLPARLDPALLSREALSRRARELHPRDLSGFRESALAWLAGTELEDGELRELLSRLDRPDLPGLPALVVRELRIPGGRFGALAIHRELRLEHLEECARLEPALLRDGAYVDAVLERMRPGADSDWPRDPAGRRAQLERLWDFARRLPAAHNSLKAHVLHHLLRSDLERGTPDRERFLEYVRLPGRSALAPPDRGQRTPPAEWVDSSRAFPTGLPSIGDDRALVRACLEHFFASEDRADAFSEWLDARWLEGVLAETKLLTGHPDAARWYALLGDPARVEALARRVEIEFPPTRRAEYAANEPVVLEADVKNVPMLVVRTYALDSYRWHVEEQRELDASIELDGLIATSEETFRYDEPPVRRVRRRFELPALAGPGAYVIELVGNGVASRALVRKGALRHTLDVGAAGHVFAVFDETGARLADASVWFGGREHAPGPDGAIVVPFTTEPGTKKAVLRHGERSALVELEARAEEYELRAPWHVDREALVAGERARLVVRPMLSLAQRPVALALLEDPVLTVVSTDLDGLATTSETRALGLADERELVHELVVPERLARLSVRLRGTLRDLRGERVEVESRATSIGVNGIDATAGTSSAQLLLAPGGYALELRGKDGETRAGRALTVTLDLRDFADPFEVALETDARGRVELGALDGVTRVRFDLGGGARGHVELVRSAVARLGPLHGLAGETLRVPYQGAASAPTREAFSLLGEGRDAFSHLALADGFVELRGLEPGDYELALHETGETIGVRVTRGTDAGRWLLGRARSLEDARAPLHVRALEASGEELVVRLANAGPGSRVLAVATRWLAPFDPFERLRDDQTSAPGYDELDPATCEYAAGRALGDEARYVLERRFAAKFPGNMLPRPSLLLAPWELDAHGYHGTGSASSFASRRAAGRAKKGRAPMSGGSPSYEPEWHPGSFANLDWLPRPSATLAGLVPDAQGAVRVPLAALGDGQLVHVLALDGEQAVYATLVRAERELAPRSRRLAKALDATVPLVEERRIELLPAGGEAVLDDARTTAAARLDSLASVHRLLVSITGDDELARFEFVARWPSVPREERLELYSRHACHELNFFLHEKDRAFFDEVVRPFVANKLHKTFLDRWLLGEDLRAYLEPWAFADLNVIERILLARALGGGERDAVARLVREAYQARRPDAAWLRRLFDLALANDTLARAKDAPPREGADVEEEAGAGGDSGAFVGPAGPTTPGPAAPGAPGAPAVAAEEKAAEEKAAEQEVAPDLAAERAADAERRARVRPLYRPVQPTRRLIESDYWRLARRRGDDFPGLVDANAFWRDYAAAPEDRPFVSGAVAEASGSFLEAMFALAVLDLPFEAGEHALAADGARRTLRAATPLLLVRAETAPARAESERPALLLGEGFLRIDQPTRVVDGETVDRLVTDEFLTDVAYVCRVVVTNPTSSARTVELLLQIPEGALPVRKGFRTRGETVALDPFSTRALEYAFYFPAPGTFAHYPVHAAERGELAGAAQPVTLRVVDVPTSVDASSWEALSQRGSAEQVLEYVDAANAVTLNLGRVAWRLRERAFFDALIGRLRGRMLWSDVVWSYGVFHQDARATREWLGRQDELVAGLGAYLDSPLLAIEPVSRHLYRHVELDPLVHPRAHHAGPRTASAVLAREYGALLEALGWKPRLDAADWQALTYHLLLQDRVADALAAFERIEPARVASRLQHDYLSAYLCFYTGDVERARALAEPHRAHPVTRWRERFGDVLAQLDEVRGAPGKPAEAEDAGDLAASEPSLELAGSGRELVVRARNLSSCEVRYYPLDVELAFSAQPFAEARDAAAWVQPTAREVLALAPDERELPLRVPERFAGASVRVEVRAGGLARSRVALADALDVRWLEPYGQVAVADAGGAPLARAYVKVFARMPDGRVSFHKDGYTDLRGRFDYASVSDDPHLAAERYAVLVLADGHGADVREVRPPAR